MYAEYAHAYDTNASALGLMSVPKLAFESVLRSCCA